MIMKSIVLFISLYVILVFVQNTNGEEDGAIKAGEEDGIKVYRRLIPADELRGKIIFFFN